MTPPFGGRTLGHKHLVLLSDLRTGSAYRAPQRAKCRALGPGVEGKMGYARGYAKLTATRSPEPGAVISRLISILLNSDVHKLQCIK